MKVNGIEQLLDLHLTCGALLQSAAQQTDRPQFIRAEVKDPTPFQLKLSQPDMEIGEMMSAQSHPSSHKLGWVFLFVLFCFSFKILAFCRESAGKDQLL